MSPCVPPGGHVHMCVAVFVSPQAEKADNWRCHVPHSGDCSGGRRLQSAARGESMRSLRREFDREKLITAKPVLLQVNGGGV